MWRPGLPKIARQGRGGATAQRAFGLHEGRATRLSGWRVTTTWALCGESRAPAAEGANAVHHAQGPLLWAQSARWLRKGAGHQALADVFLTLTGRLAAAEGENKNSEPSLPFCSATGNPKFLKPIRFCSKTQDARAPPPCTPASWPGLPRPAGRGTRPTTPVPQEGEGTGGRPRPQGASQHTMLWWGSPHGGEVLPGILSRVESSSNTLVSLP